MCVSLFLLSNLTAKNMDTVTSINFFSETEKYTWTLIGTFGYVHCFYMQESLCHLSTEL